MAERKPIVIIGSVNMDLVARVSHVPAPGETILGRDFVMLPGGKGANQAVAAARLGAAARILGRVGDDELGRRLLSELQAAGVSTGQMRVTPGVASGIAMITVADDGENAITVASGANFAVTPNDLDEWSDSIRHAAICVLQLELPVETVCRALSLCQQHGVPTVLDPAPVPAAPHHPQLFGADIISPNETEAAALTGLTLDSPPQRVAEVLHGRGARMVVLKLGARGCYVSSEMFTGAVPGFAVEAVDTTAAGDAFTGALAVALSEGRPIQQAARFANAAGALACTRIGAQTAMPRREHVNALLNAAP